MESNSSVFRKSTRKAPAIKNAVTAKRIAGQSNAQISRDLGIAVNTVKSIARLTDVDRMFEDGRLGTLQRIPEALKTLDVRLEKNSENAALWVLDKCFDNNKVTGQHMTGDTVLNQTLNVLLRGPETAKSDSETRTVEVKPDTPEQV